MSERAKIRARRVTGNYTQQQRAGGPGDPRRARDGAAALQRAPGHASARAAVATAATAASVRDRGAAASVERRVDVRSTPTAESSRSTEAEPARRGRSRPTARSRSTSTSRSSVDGARSRRREGRAPRGRRDARQARVTSLEVADGYARNYLVPRGLAMKATKGVVAQAEAMRRNREATRGRATARPPQEIAAQLGSQPIQVKARAGEGGKLFGSVTAADVADAVLAQTGHRARPAQGRCSTSRSRSWATSRCRSACTPRSSSPSRSPSSRSDRGAALQQALLHEVVGGEPARDRGQVGHRELVGEHRGRRRRRGHPERGDHPGQARPPTPRCRPRGSAPATRSPRCRC